MRSLTINGKKWINLIVKKYPVNRNLDSSFSVQFLGFKICIHIMLFSSIKGNCMETCFGCVVHAGQSTK